MDSNFLKWQGGMKRILSLMNGSVFSLLGFLVSLIAAWFAWSANDMAMQQNTKTTDPFLILELEKIPSTDPQMHELGLYYKNVGLGPAFVLGFEAHKNGKPITNFPPLNGHDLAASFGLKNNATTRDEIRPGQVIPVGGRITIFKVKKWNDNFSPIEFSALVEKSLSEHSLAICYSSIYPERRFGLFGKGLNKDNVGCTKVQEPKLEYVMRTQLSQEK